jgi:hypothetical protein
VEVEVKRQYPNMRQYLEKFPHVVEAAERARAPRGWSRSAPRLGAGAEGSILSEMGLPTANLFTGGHEYHSVRELRDVTSVPRVPKSAAGPLLCATSGRSAAFWGRLLRTSSCPSRRAARQLLRLYYPHQLGAPGRQLGPAPAELQRC